MEKGQVLTRQEGLGEVTISASVSLDLQGFQRLIFARECNLPLTSVFDGRSVTFIGGNDQQRTAERDSRNCGYHRTTSR